MRILDQKNNEMKPESVDFAQGHLVEEKIVKEHHEAQERVAPKFHFETEREYPNGGKDVRKVIDDPGQPAKDAWDEYEDILRYTPWTSDEIARNTQGQVNRARTNNLTAVAELFVQANTPAINDDNAERLSVYLPLYDEKAEYPQNTIVRYEGKIFRCTQKTPAGNLPDAKDSKYWNRIGKPDADGVYTWIQPASGDEGYSKGDIVNHDSKRYTSNMDRNVFVPGESGWTEVTSK